MSLRIPSIVLTMLAISVLFRSPLPAQFLYVANSGANNVSGYTVNAFTGALTEIQGSPFAASGSPASVAVHPSGRFVYATGYYDTAGINGYLIDARTGQLSSLAGSPFPAAGGNVVIAIQPSGKFAYVTSTGYEVLINSIQRKTGGLEFLQTSEVVPVSVHNLLIHPSGKFVYLTQDCALSGNVCDSDAPNTVQGYAADAKTAALTPLPGSPYAAGSTTGSLAVDPEGRFLYAGNKGSLDISAYTVDRSTGALTPITGSPFAAGSMSPLAMAVAAPRGSGHGREEDDAGGGFLYVSRGDSMIWGYKIDRTTGALTGISGSPWGDGNLSLAISVDCTGKFLYAADYYAGSVSAFRIERRTGALTSVEGSPFPAGNTPVALAEACGARDHED